MNLTKEQILAIGRLRMTGKTNREIAGEMKVSASTIMRWAKRLRESGRNVPKRKAGMRKIEL